MLIGNLKRINKQSDGTVSTKQVFQRLTKVTTHLQTEDEDQSETPEVIQGTTGEVQSKSQDTRRYGKEQKEEEIQMQRRRIPKGF